jgi:hypothetical protein
MRSLFLLLALLVPSFAQADPLTEFVNRYTVVPSKNISAHDLFELFAYTQNNVGNGQCYAHSTLFSVDSVQRVIVVDVYTTRMDGSAATDDAIARICHESADGLVADWGLVDPNAKITIVPKPQRAY